jgi:hypothetical protein
LILPYRENKSPELLHIPNMNQCRASQGSEEQREEEGKSHGLRTPYCTSHTPLIAFSKVPCKLGIGSMVAEENTEAREAR